MRLICWFQVTFLIACLTLTRSAAAEDWSRFRGPNGTGVAAQGTELPTTWSETENLKWKTKLPGAGSSCPIVVGDKIYVTCWSGYGLDRRNPGQQEDLQRHLVCVDRTNGKIVWDKTVSPYLPEDEYGGMFAEHGYASHTPVSDGQHIYCYFGKTGAVAFDLDGNELWKRQIGTESGARGWGSASSPILYKDVLIVTATAESEALVGLNKNTGEEIWRKEASGFNSTWGTPVLVPVDDQRTDVVIAVPGEIWAFDPETGALRWYCEAFGSNSMCSSVVPFEDTVIAIESGPGGGGGIAVKVGGQKDVTDSHIAWQGNQSNRIGTPIIIDRRIYVFGNGVVTCLDAKTGDDVFKTRLQAPAAANANSSADDANAESGGRGAGQGRGGFGGRGGRGGGGRGGQDYGSPIAANGVIYYTTRSGVTYVIQAGEELKQIAANKVTSETEDFSATPAIADGQLIIRSDKHLYCVAK